MKSPADNIPLSIAAILLAVFALSLGDALIKKFNASFSVWQIFILRSAMAAPVLAAILLARAAPVLPRRFGWGALRSMLLAAMWLAYYAALPHLQLSAAAAVYYTTPIFIVLFAALGTRARVGMRGWGAVLLGFCGVLLILRPRAGDFNPWALLPLVSALCYAFAMLITRLRCRDEHPLTLALGLHFAFIFVGVAGAGILRAADFFGAGLGGANFSRAPGDATAGAFLAATWPAMGAPQWTLMCALSVAALIGSIGPAIAYRLAPPPIVAPFDFAYLAFAVMWGVVLFADTPDFFSAVGILLIAAAGMVALRPAPQR